jgi:hypothetical protein
VAEDGTLVVGQQHGEDVTLATQLRVAQGVHAACDADEAAVGDPVVDRVRAEAEPQQLAPRHESVLARRQRVDRPFDGTEPAHMTG